MFLALAVAHALDTLMCSKNAADGLQLGNNWFADCNTVYETLFMQKLARAARLRLCVCECTLFYVGSN